MRISDWSSDVCSSDLWYPWHGAERTRSFAEFHLLAEMADQGLPVPAPLAARYQRDGAGYRADILIQRVAGAVPLAGLLRNDRNAAHWEQEGATNALFHRTGIRSEGRRVGKECVSRCRIR